MLMMFLGNLNLKNGGQKSVIPQYKISDDLDQNELICKFTSYYVLANVYLPESNSKHIEIRSVKICSALLHL